MYKKFLKSTLTILLLIVSISSYANWGLTKHTIYKRANYKLSDVARVNRLAIKSSDTKQILTNKYHNFVFTPDSKKAQYNGIELLLSFPVVKLGGILYISSIDYNTIVLPLTARASLIKHPTETIFIDPGHGGNDEGASGVNLKEKNLTLQVALKLASLLRSKGYKVVMSRTNDKKVELPARVALANKHNANLFISIHFNATGTKSVNGIETYCLTPATAASTNSSTPENTSYYGNKYDRNNFALAYLTQRFLIKDMEEVDRGVKHARFLVLRDIRCPAILVECGFMTHRTSEIRFSKEAYINKLAISLAKAIISYSSATKPN